VPCTAPAVVEAVRSTLWGGEGASAHAAAAAAAAGVGAAEAAGSMARAIAQNAPYIRSVLKRPFLPMCPATRHANAPLLGASQDVIGGCRVEVSIARAAPMVTAACEAALGRAAGGGAGAGALLAAAVRAADLARLGAAGRAGGGVLRVGGEGGGGGGGGLVPLEGTHYFDNPERALASLSEGERAAGGLPREWVA
jgi:hypothetical protein